MSATPILKFRRVKHVFHLTTSAEGGNGFNPFLPDPGLYIWTAVAFFTVLYFLAKKVLPTLQKGLADREQKIKSEIEEAEALKRDAEEILSDYKVKVKTAGDETTRMIEDARAAAASVRDDLVVRAESDARSIVEKARRQLVGERERTLSELEGQLAEWAVAIAGQIVQKELTPGTQSDLIDEFIKDVSEKAPAP